MNLQTKNKNNLEYVLCPICDIDDNKQFAVSNGLTIVKCNHCGLLYVNPRLQRDDIAHYFEDEYIVDCKRVVNDFISNRKVSLKREAKRIKMHMPQGGRLLDIGSASGEFLRQFSQDKKWIVQGIEPSRYAAEYSRKTFGLNVFNGFLTDTAFPDNTFDVITSLDTFFLHPDPRNDLQEIARMIKPGGLFAVEIPGLNFRIMKNTGPICKILYGEPVRLNAGVHLYYYNKETFCRLVSKYGFAKVAYYAEQSPLRGNKLLHYINWSYYYFSSFLDKITNSKVSFVSKEFLVFRNNKK